ncbi:hypothetical protein [uncultured Cellulomonas sp.]|nr:hypothetical protein [uncultured Cellulomonas sp.]
MTPLVVILVLTALVLLVADVVTVRHDGLGTLEPPRSHPRDDLGWPGRFV